MIIEVASRVFSHRWWGCMFPGFKTILLVLVGISMLGQPARAQISSSLELETVKQPVTRKVKADWRITVGGGTAEHGKDEAAGAFLWADSRLTFTMLEGLWVYANPILSLESMRVQERFGEFDDNGIGFYDFYLGYSPVEFLELRAGAHNQSHLGTSMLVSGLRSFPGLQETLKGEVSGIKARLVLQQLIPTSHSLNTERETQEELPTFMTQSLIMSGEHFNWVKWEMTAGHYDWNNIPDKVVAESRLLGNVGTGDIVPGSKFIYDHEGLFGTAEVCICSDESWMGAVVEFQRVMNQRAPGDAADAQLFGGGPRFNFGERVLDLRVRSFFIESDATIAAYNKSRFGHTNRVGTNIEASLEFKKEGFAIFAEYYNAQTINRDPNQFDLEIYRIGLETTYASF